MAARSQRYDLEINTFIHSGVYALLLCECITREKKHLQLLPPHTPLTLTRAHTRTQSAHSLQLNLLATSGGGIVQHGGWGGFSDGDWRGSAV